MFDRAWRSNSCSTRSNSPAIESKIRFASTCASSKTADVSAAGIVCGINRLGLFSDLVRSIVRELHIDTEVAGFQRGNYLLQGIAIAARDPDRVALDRGLHFGLRVLDQLDDILRLFLGNALLNLRALAHRASRRGFDRAIAQSLQWDPATHQ